MKQHLEFMEKAHGKRNKLLDQPVVWEEDSKPYAAMIIDIFFQMSGTRQQGMNGAMPIQFIEIQAWCNLNEYILTPFEIQLIKMLDRLYINASHQPNE